MTDSTARTAVVTTAWRRPYYFEPVLKSWAQADGIADIARFVIALGTTDRFDAMMELIERMRPQFPCPVEVAVQSKRAVRSRGPHRAIGEAGNLVFSDPSVDFLVFGEEDILVSSDVLAYMAWARDKFAGDGKVLCACAHNQTGSGWDPVALPQDADADQHAVRLLPYYSGWVWATWRDRWEQVLEPSWDWECDTGSQGFDSGYDWNIQLRVMPSGGYVNVVPDASRSQNTGRMEAWSKPPLFGATQSKSFRDRREPGGYELVTP